MATAGSETEENAGELSAESATTRAYSSILHNTLAGTYRAGERLTEARLTTDLGLSRVPVREALQRLAHEGVIDLHRHRGATIRVTSRRDMAEFFQVRSMLESNCAAAAAVRIREPSCTDEMALMIAHMAQLQEWTAGVSADPGDNYVDHNNQFHQLIIDLSGNQLLIKVWGNLQLPVYRLNYFQRYRPGDIQTSMHDHARIGASILVGDSGAAARAAGEHVNRIAALLYTLSDHDFNRIFNPGLISPAPRRARPDEGYRGVSRGPATTQPTGALGT